MAILVLDCGTPTWQALAGLTFPNYDMSGFPWFSMVVFPLGGATRSVGEM